jgi:peptidoglycan/xylan/chitin deacetylase (PgdA/CDA1 family)
LRQEAAKVPPSILTYHKIGRQFELGITSVTRQRFACHLDVIQALGRDLVTASRAAAGPHGGANVVLTFDDGYQSVFTEAFPEMAARRAVGTVFPVVHAIGRLNDWDVRLSPRRFKHLSWLEIGELVRSGFELGSHTLSHRDLTRLSRADLDTELRASRQILEDRIGAGVKAVAYPFGKANARVIDAALAAGYSLGFVSAPGLRPDGAGRGLAASMGQARGADPPCRDRPAPHDEVSGRMAIGRMSVYVGDGPRSLRRKLGASPGYGLEAFKNRLIARLSHGTSLVKR